MSGWQVGISLPLPGSTVNIFNQATAPTQPPPIALNSLWFNSTNDSLSQWNGSAWVQVLFAGTEIISASTIDATLIAAGTIVAGIVNGTEIDGSIFRAKNAFGATILTINKTTATWILYADTGSATQGMVVASATNATVATTDEFSNQILAGTVTYGGVSGAWTAVSFFGGNAIAYYTSTAATQTGFTTTTSINFAAATGRASITDSTNLVRNITRSTSQATGQVVGNTVTTTALYAGVFHTSTDLAVGDEIIIETPFNARMGQTTAETFQIGYQLDGGATVTILTIGAAIVALNTVFSGLLRFSLRILTTGTGGTVQFWINGMIQQAVNVLFTNSGGFSSTILPGVAFDTTVVHTLMLVGTWGGAGGSAQNFTTLGSTYTEY